VQVIGSFLTKEIMLIRNMLFKNNSSIENHSNFVHCQMFRHSVKFCIDITGFIGTSSGSPFCHSFCHSCQVDLYHS
jgi:hypothetical protein